MPAQMELQSLVVRPIEPEEKHRWNQLMNKHHYLGFRQLVGESIKYVAELNDQWVALLGWGTAAFKCGSRDEWIGWSREQQWRRLTFLTNNSRFLILPHVRIPNLASKILSLNLKRLSADWMVVFGHPLRKIVLKTTENGRLFEYAHKSITQYCAVSTVVNSHFETPRKLFF